VETSSGTRGEKPNFFTVMFSEVCFCELQRYPHAQDVPREAGRKVGIGCGVVGHDLVIGFLFLTHVKPIYEIIFNDVMASDIRLAVRKTLRRRFQG